MWRCAVSARAGAWVRSSQVVWRAQGADRASACARAHSLAAPAHLLATGQAAAMLSDNPRRFADTVKQTFQGRTMQAPPPPAAASHRVCRGLERGVPGSRAWRALLC